MKKFTKLFGFILIASIFVTLLSLFVAKGIAQTTLPAIFKSVCNSVYLRTGPYTSNAALIKVNIGDRVTVVKEVSAGSWSTDCTPANPKSSAIWYKITTVRGVSVTKLTNGARDYLYSAKGFYQYVSTADSQSTPPDNPTPTTTSSDGLTKGRYCTLGNTKTCGYYKLNNTAGINYGDYKCDLIDNGAIIYKKVNDALLNELGAYGKKKDYCRWRCIIGYESDYNANKFYAFTPDPAGGWGLFSTEANACESTTLGTTGNVVWGQQIKNSLKRNYNVLGGSFRYWSVYAHTCYAEPDWDPDTKCACAGNKPGCR